MTSRRGSGMFSRPRAVKQVAEKGCGMAWVNAGVPAFPTDGGMPLVVGSRAQRGEMQGSATTAMREHRRGAMTPQMAPRRRNPKGGRHVNAGTAGVLYCRGPASGGRVPAPADWR